MSDAAKQEPPGFPYPGEEVIYSSAMNAPNHEPGEDSWFCVSKPEEEKVHQFGEKEHRNDYRFTIHSPLRGSVSFFINGHDANHILRCMFSVLADDESMQDKVDRYDLSMNYYNSLISEDYEVGVIDD